MSPHPGHPGEPGRVSPIPTPPSPGSCPLAVRRLARKRRGGSDEDAAPLSLSYKIHVATENNFPTAAGLASSAAGYACLGG